MGATSLSLLITVFALFGATSARAQSGPPTPSRPIPVAAAVSGSSDEPPSTRVVAGIAGSTTLPTLPAKVAAGSASAKVKVRLAAASLPSPAEILANPSLVLSEQAKSDIRSGVVDPRLLGTLGAISKRFTIEIRVLRSGHSRTVKGTTRDSNHFYGRAADIYKVDGVLVTKENQSALALANFLLTLPGDIRPTELGSPWTGNGSSVEVEVFSDPGHAEHIHIGFDD
jgi:hypothetical protein